MASYDRPGTDDSAPSNEFAAGEDQGIVADPDIILDYQRIIIKNIRIHNTELLLIKGGMRRQCVGGVINGCGPNAVGNGAIAPDLDGPRHPPLIEAAIGIKADIHSVAFAEPCAQRRSEEHTSELQSLMRISYAVFCSKKKKNK